MSKITDLQKSGQSIWYDNIRRAMLSSGELQRLIDLGVTGVTSNPSIFEKAITGSSDYDASVKELTTLGYDPNAIYEALVSEDIRAASDILSPIYQRTGGKDGYISLEVSPTLAEDTKGTIEEARRLFTALDQPNVMIKVPATPQGIAAIENLIFEGINVNITLIFSLQQYEAVAQAYLSGLEKRVAAKKDLSKVASVASFFISRVDSLADAALLKAGLPDLQGKTALANAKIAYLRFEEIFQGKRWDQLAAAGAQRQRPLWASTGTKNPAYADTLYIDALIGQDTVNTVPPVTLEAYLDHGEIEPSLSSDIDSARQHLSKLEEAGIDLNGITAKLLEDGLAAFVKSFETLHAGIAEKQYRFRSGWSQVSVVS